jgi:hypothetical protein
MSIPQPRAEISAWWAGVALGLALVTFGWLTTPGVNPLSPAGAYVILVAYGGVGYALARRLHRLNPRPLGLVGLFGLLAGAVFLGEVALEYVVLPADNSTWGLVEYASVFLFIFTASLLAAARSGQVRQGVLAGLGSALLASLVFIGVILIFFYAFRGTPQQAQVFQAEGNYADFSASGLQDFNIFIMEDIFGAIFFHSLLLPLAGTLLAVFGGLIGKGLARFNPRH